MRRQSLDREAARRPPVTYTGRGRAFVDEGAAFKTLASFTREAHRRIDGMQQGAAELGTVKNRVRALWKRSSENRLGN